MNMHQWAQNLRESELRVAIPIMTHPGIEFTGKKVIDAVTSGQAQFEAIMAVNEHYPAAAATIIMDLTVEAEAFGCPILFADDEVPTVTGRIVSSAEDIANLTVPSLDKGRIGEYLKATRLAAGAIIDKPVLAGCIGPFSLAGRLYDMTEIMTAAFLEPESIHQLVGKATQFLISYIKEMKKTGARGIVIAEPAAGLLPSDLCQAFSSDFVKQIVDAVQDENFIVILHNCGNTGQVTAEMVNTGARGLHFGNKIDMVQVCREVPSDILVLGNLDPVNDFKMATADEMRARTTELLEKTSGFPNFIVSSGCDTPPHVPLANIEAFYEALKAFNGKLAKVSQ